MKILKRLLWIMLSIFAISQIVLQMKKVNATTIGDINYVKREEKGYYTIQFYNGQNWSYITYSITSFVDSDGITRVAYCTDPYLNGVGWINGEFEGYDVKVKELLSDARLWRVYTNGYPYKSPEELGVETAQDAYLATKQAAYAVINGYTVDELKTTYRAGQDPIDGQNLDETKRRGTKVLDAMFKLIDIGYYGTETPQYNNILTINNQGNFKEDTNNKNYYSQTYKVDSTVQCNGYTVTEVSNFPDGTFIANKNGKEQTSFNGGETFKVMIPKASITKNIQGTINISGKCDNYPIYYAECNIGDYQSYVLCSENDIQASTTLLIDANKSGLQIEKIDKDTKEQLSGVKFSIKYEDGTDLGIYETDKNGKIEIKNIKQGNLLITEVETNENYILNTKTNYLKLAYNESKNIVIENERKKGNIKIIKVDADNNEIKIKGAKFDVYNGNKELVGTVTTDKNGEAIIKNLPINSEYTIKEIKTHKDYILSEKEITIKLEEHNITKNIEIKNEKKKGNIKIIKVDADKNEIKIKGAKFEIYNENKELIRTVITDENGEALIENLPINSKYTIKEIETAEDYILSEESVTIQLNENEIKTLTFKNKKKEKEIQKLPRTGEINMSNYLLSTSVIGILINKKLCKKREE